VPRLVESIDVHPHGDSWLLGADGEDDGSTDAVVGHQFRLEGQRAGGDPPVGFVELLSERAAPDDLAASLRQAPYRTWRQRRDASSTAISRARNASQFRS
jgi:hypothetical protein